MTNRPLKLGFVGLGIMGTPMAGHLIAAGHQLFVYTLGKMPDLIAQSSATQCTSARGVAERADIVFLMVPDTPDVEGRCSPRTASRQASARARSSWT